MSSKPIKAWAVTDESGKHLAFGAGNSFYLIGPDRDVVRNYASMLDSIVSVTITTDKPKRRKGARK